MVLDTRDGNVRSRDLDTFQLKQTLHDHGMNAERIVIGGGYGTKILFDAEDRGRKCSRKEEPSDAEIQEARERGGVYG